MIDVKLAEAALYSLIALVAFISAIFVLFMATCGRPVLAFLYRSIFVRLSLANLTGRDWATVVMAASAAGIVFVTLSAPGLALFLREITK